MAFPQVMHNPTNVPYATLGKWSNLSGTVHPCSASSIGKGRGDGFLVARSNQC